MMNAIRIKALTQGPEEITFKDDQPLWEQIGEQVGGYFEVVRNTPQAAGLPKGIVMVVNEEGLLCNLPYNHVGSLLYPGQIRGDLLLMKEGYTDEGPDFVTMTDEDQIEVALAMISLLRSKVENVLNFADVSGLINRLKEDGVFHVPGAVVASFNNHDCETCELKEDCISYKEKLYGEDK